MKRYHQWSDDASSHHGNGQQEEVNVLQQAGTEHLPCAHPVRWNILFDKTASCVKLSCYCDYFI